MTQNVWRTWLTNTDGDRAKAAFDLDIKDPNYDISHVTRELG